MPKVKAKICCQRCGLVHNSAEVELDQVETVIGGVNFIYDPCLTCRPLASKTSIYLLIAVAVAFVLIVWVLPLPK